MKGKIYWIILVLAAIGVASTIIWIGGRPTSIKESEEFVTPLEKEIEVKLKMGVGYSTKIDFKTAVEDAYTKMMKQLEGEKPKFIILSSSVGYDQKKLLVEVNKLLPEVKVYGYTSFIGIMANDGFHVGEGTKEGYALGMMGFATDAMVFGVGASSLDEAASPFEAGKIAISRAIENAEKTGKDKPKVVLLSSAPFGMGEEFVIAGVESIVGKDVPLVGGGAAAGYSDFSGGQALFANDKVYQKGVVAVPIYTDLKIGHAILAGCNPTEKKGTVTKFKRDATGLYIIEIDREPAAEVYNDWTGGAFSEFLGTSEFFLGKSVFHMLGKEIIEPGGITNWQMVVALHFNPNNSITVGAVTEEGSKVHLLECNPDLFIQRPALAIRLARSRAEIVEAEIAGIVMDQCGATLVGIPRGVSDWNKMISLINEAGGRTPFLGASNFGPYGYFPGAGNRYAEVTTSVLIFSKD